MDIRATAPLLLAFLGAISARPAVAQDSTRVRLMGEVRDVANEQPVEGAAVKVLELGRVETTDRNGFFAFDSLPVGTWTFETSQFGFKTNTEASTIAPDNFLLVRLQAKPIELEGLLRLRTSASGAATHGSTVARDRVGEARVGRSHCPRHRLLHSDARCRAVRALRRRVSARKTCRTASCTTAPANGCGCSWTTLRCFAQWARRTTFGPMIHEICGR